MRHLPYTLGGRYIQRVTQQTPLHPLNNLKIAHLNIRASGQVLSKPQATILHCARQNTDIMCITEVKISRKNYNYYHHKDYQYLSQLTSQPPGASPQGRTHYTNSENIMPRPPPLSHISTQAEPPPSSLNSLRIPSNYLSNTKTKSTLPQNPP